MSVKEDEMKIGIIGAGFAGLSSAKVLTQLGHRAVVYEKTADVGGVWSASRRYPGLKTQNNKGSYALSDLPMPAAYPEWPAGEQVQAYLERYVDLFGLRSALRLSTEVTLAEPDPAGGWNLGFAGGDDDHADHLVLASGIFSRPFVPAFEGAAELSAAGGSLIPSSELHSLDQVRGRHAVVVGYGKSACDVAVEVASAAASTTVVARELLWKMPRKVRGVVNYKYLMLTRLGEGLFRYHTPVGMERLLHAGGSKIAGGMLGTVQKVTTRQLGLPQLGLVPHGTFADIARSTVSLATEGFFEQVANGKIAVHRDTTISRFVRSDGRPYAQLSTGESIPADIVIAATGWTQDLPFLPREVRERLVDGNGDYLLYRQIHPIDVPDLSFAGYNSSFFSPLSAEVSAIWIGSLLGGNHRLPGRDEMVRVTRERLAWMRERTGGRHAHGTNVIPFSVHGIDEALSDVGMNVGPLTRAKQWLMPIDPGDYRWIAPRLARRLGAPAAVVRQAAH